MLAVKRRQVVFGSFLGCVAVGLVGLPVWKDLGTSAVQCYRLHTDPPHLAILLGEGAGEPSARALRWFAGSEKGAARIAAAYFEELAKLHGELAGDLAAIAKGQPDMALWLWVEGGRIHRCALWRGYGGVSTWSRPDAEPRRLALLARCQELLARRGPDRLPLPGSRGLAFTLLDVELAEKLGVSGLLFNITPAGKAVVLEKQEGERWWLQVKPATETAALSSPGGEP
jgi:hypothetical protein